MPKGVYFRTEQNRLNISNAQKGKTKGKPSKRKGRHFGPFSPEHRMKISKALTGYKRGPHTEEHKQKIRISGTGWKMSDEGRHKISISKKGDKSHFWRGGLTKINAKIRNSLEYRLWRESVFQRDSYTCIWCGVKGQKLNADHIKPFCDYPQLRFAIDNGRTLCDSCHKKTDTYGWKIHHSR